MSKSAQDLLLRSLDYSLTAAERAQLEEALAASKDLQQTRDEYLKMRELLKELRVGRDYTFADRVMHKLEIEKEAGFWSDIASLSPRVAAISIAFIIISLIGIYRWEGNLSPEAIIGTEQLMPEDAITIQEKRPINKKQDKDAAPFEMPKQR